MRKLGVLLVFLVSVMPIICMAQSLPGEKEVVKNIIEIEKIKNNIFVGMTSEYVKQFLNENDIKYSMEKKEKIILPELNTMKENYTYQLSFSVENKSGSWWNMIEEFYLVTIWFNKNNLVADVIINKGYSGP